VVLVDKVEVEDLLMLLEQVVLVEEQVHNHQLVEQQVIHLPLAHHKEILEEIEAQVTNLVEVGEQDKQDKMLLDLMDVPQKEEMV
tara:strand:+ start:219 stop:473 length:255 start_codon:yes stop_codon:yes gene_type:complete